MAVIAACGFAIGASAQPDPSVPATVRFGVLPTGGAVESRERWEPLLADLSRAVGRPVAVFSGTSYESLDQAIRRNEIDMAMLPAKMALDAVVDRRMTVLAQVRRPEGQSEHRAVLLTRKAGPLNRLEDLLAHPERWRLARGDSRSVSGFMLPQLQLFLPNRIAMETRFRSEMIDTHQATALAVANGDADVATNNTTDFERFRQQFPQEADRLQVVWKSDATPQAQIVVQRDLSPSFRRKLQAFLAGYGHSSGPHGDAEREVLKSLQASLGYTAVGNQALLPAAKLEYQLARQSALNAQWVSHAAREAKLKRIDDGYAAQVAALGIDEP